jgi:hypothetical protein
MVPPMFPLLLVVPAFGIDLVFRALGKGRGWRRDLLLIPMLAVAFTTLFTLTQWEFSSYLISPSAENWFFAGSQFFTFADAPSDWWHQFWRMNVDPVNSRGLFIALLLATASSGAGLAVGNWMSKVKR